MKKIFALIAVLCCFNTSFIQLNAQNASPIIYGSDVQVAPGSMWTGTKSHIAVAENGWIFILVKKVYILSGTQKWELYKSVDNGFHYQMIKDWSYNGTDWILKDCDLAVTGTNSSNIRIWVAEVADSPTTEPYARINKFTSSGVFDGTPYYLDYGNTSNTLNSVAITTDYRSPGTDGSPFSMAIAFTGTWNGVDWLTYAYSLDGGNTFAGRDPFSAASGTLGKVSVSIGAWMGAIGGRAAIAFEKDMVGGKGNIGLLANNYDFGLDIWSGAFNINSLYAPNAGKCRNPSIQLMNNTATTPPQYAFLVAFEDYSDGDSEGDIMICYPKSGFSVYGEPEAADFGCYWNWILNSNNEIQPSLGYDKAWDNFLMTYFTTEGNRLIYKFVAFDAINDYSAWADYGNYRDAATDNVGPYPDIDINPVFAQVCFSWSEEDGVYADAEWLNVGDLPETASGLKVWPNPIGRLVNVELKDATEYRFALYSNEGKLLMQENISGTTCQIDLTNYPAGSYLLEISAKEKVYRQTLLKSK